MCWSLFAARLARSSPLWLLLGLWRPCRPGRSAFCFVRVADALSPWADPAPYSHVEHGPSRQRREPEGTVLYRIVQSEWTTVQSLLAHRERHIPRFCRREVEGFLRCGILAHGFARVFCEDCRQDEVVAFSCKGRGFCPSNGHTTHGRYRSVLGGQGDPG